jgi:DNA-binding NarL/FixJ family response regulator
VVPEEWKNQAELLQELNALRKRVAEFEQSSRSLKYKQQLMNENHDKHTDQYLTKPLTKTEMKILHLILNGKSNKEIASLLHRSVRTIEVHRSHIMRKFDADNLIDLFKRAAIIGLVELPEASHDNDTTREQTTGTES